MNPTDPLRPMSINPIAFVVIAAVLWLSGCAVAPRVEQMTVTAPSTASASVPEGLRQNIAFVLGEGTFPRALEASLREANLLQPNRQAGRFTLTAQFRNLDVPSFGANMTATAAFRYVLVEQTTGKTFLDKTITTPYTARFVDALIGVERSQLAREGALRANIAQLIGELTRLSPEALAAPAPTPTSTTASAAVATPTIPQHLQPATVVEPNAGDSSRNYWGAVFAECESRGYRRGTPELTSCVSKLDAEGYAVAKDSAPSAEGRANVPPEVVATKVNPPPAVSQPTATTTSSPPTADVPDLRSTEMKQTYTTLMQQARSGKLGYLKAARLYKEKFLKLYPEESGNTVMNEYLAYMAVAGEKVDKKRWTEAEAEYELARKESELAERMNAMRAQADAQAAAAKAGQDAAARMAAEQASTRQANAAATAYQARQVQIEAERQEAARIESARQQAAIAAALQAQADEQRRANAAAMLIEGMRLLTPPPPTRQTTCRWFASNWVCN